MSLNNFANAKSHPIPVFNAALTIVGTMSHRNAILDEMACNRYFRDDFQRSEPETAVLPGQLADTVIQYSQVVIDTEQLSDKPFQKFLFLVYRNKSFEYFLKPLSDDAIKINGILTEAGPCAAFVMKHGDTISFKMSVKSDYTTLKFNAKVNGLLLSELSKDVPYPGTVNVPTRIPVAEDYDQEEIPDGVVTYSDGLGPFPGSPGWSPSEQSPRPHSPSHGVYSPCSPPFECVSPSCSHSPVSLYTSDSDWSPSHPKGGPTSPSYSPPSPVKQADFPGSPLELPAPATTKSFSDMSIKTPIRKPVRRFELPKCKTCSKPLYNADYLDYCKCGQTTTSSSSSLPCREDPKWGQTTQVSPSESPFENAAYAPHNVKRTCCEHPTWCYTDPDCQTCGAAMPVSETSSSSSDNVTYSSRPVPEAVPRPPMKCTMCRSVIVRNDDDESEWYTCVPCRLKEYARVRRERRSAPERIDLSALSDEEGDQPEDFDDQHPSPASRRNKRVRAPIADQEMQMIDSDNESDNEMVHNQMRGFVAGQPRPSALHAMVNIQDQLALLAPKPQAKFYDIPHAKPDVHDVIDEKVATVVEKSVQCGICMDVLLRPSVGNCGHAFCTTCIIKHLKTRSNNNHNKCPECREHISMRILRRCLPLDKLCNQVIATLYMNQQPAIVADRKDREDNFHMHIANKKQRH
jgi:hypothetical protein